MPSSIPGSRKLPANDMATCPEMKAASGYVAPLIEVFLGTQPFSKKLVVKSSALRPSALTRAGVVRSSSSSRPPASNSQVSQRNAPNSCQS
jgi:hypothetical protein